MRAWVGTLGTLGLLWTAVATAAAEEPAPTPIVSGTELTVSGTSGATLRIDDKPVGRLPLEAPLVVTAGPHRFQIERQGRRFESDVLTIPEGRVAELSLTPGNQGTAVAVLSLTPMILLTVHGGTLDEPKQQALRAAVQEGARAEHSVLLPTPTAAAVQSTRPADCLRSARCQLEFAAAAEARLVLRLELPALAPPAPAAVVRGEIVDVRTGQSAAHGTQPCGHTEDQLLEAVQLLTRRLISDAAKLGKGLVVVTSEPTAAQVTIDGQKRGVTPWEGPSLLGVHEVVVSKADYEPQQTKVNVVVDQTAQVAVALVAVEKEPAPAPSPAPPAPRRRPLWRLISGGVAIGLGAAVTGLGIVGVSQDGSCADRPPPAMGNCSYLYSTAGLGAAGLTVGLALTAAGIGLIAAPAPQASQTSGALK